MVADYLEYERRLGREILIPWLHSAKMDLKNYSVLDVGCGYGGILESLNETHSLKSALGIDIDSEMILLAQKNKKQGLQFEKQDFLKLEPQLQQFDFILMRDVLEHIVDVEKALLQAQNLIRGPGFLYLSFAPFNSPFGGHQHNGMGWGSYFPWIHLLPEKMFREIVNIHGNTYKSKDQLSKDMESVLKTRLTLRRFRQALSQTGFRILRQTHSISRPDYQIKFGLPALPCPTFLGFEEFFCTGYEALLKKL